ncbi:hypothetical protein [Streptomyces sp. 6-11-2]|uniref:hypothetical protein n=1 Tax=Streptomyces sp. 6-11-2 TaxID=2585753 RepID=UPI0011412C4B|nr:hypothetical protein [Streptomyces sp. 6-11-2]GED90600.1 hypothetical protein TNCT6_76850 [Streptomyces sp. 6-11-2]
MTTLAARTLGGRLFVATGDDTGRVTVSETDCDRWPPGVADRPVDTFTLPGPVEINALDYAPDG